MRYLLIRMSLSVSSAINGRSWPGAYGEKILPTLPFRLLLCANFSMAHTKADATPIGPYDVLIAGQARSRDATLVTHNTKEFGRVPGLRCDDWQA
jgi:hypothetical protein